MLFRSDGRSFAPLLRGEPFTGREWIHSFLGTARWLRDRRWLLDGEGQFYDCGDSRDEIAGYRDVTDSIEPDVLAARSRFAGIVATLPAPDVNDPVLGPALQRFDERRVRRGERGASARSSRGNGSESVQAGPGGSPVP